MIADIAVILFVLAFVCFGYKSGIINTVIGFFSYFLSVIISVAVNPMVSAFIRKTFVADYVYKLVLANIQKNGVPQSGIFSKFSGMVYEEITNYISVFIINIISFALALILCRLILYFISKTLRIFSKLPVISTLNGICGAILGGFEGILILYILAVLLLILPLGKNQRLTDEIENSQIAGKIYTENIITDVLGKDVLNIEQ